MKLVSYLNTTRTSMIIMLWYLSILMIVSITDSVIVELISYMYVVLLFIGIHYFRVIRFSMCNLVLFCSFLCPFNNRLLCCVFFCVFVVFIFDFTGTTFSILHCK